MIFLVRDTSPQALNWIGRAGYRPKPSAIKGKTLKAEDLKGIPPNQVNNYLGLASAKNLSPADKQAIVDAGYKIQPGEPELILDADGSRFYSDTDLHGVYDLKGNDAWSNNLMSELRCGTLDKGIQHPPHDDWQDRNNKAVAKGNYGPQIGGKDNKTITAVLPDCTTLQIGTLDEMKQLYKAIGVNWNKVYPNQ